MSRNPDDIDSFNVSVNFRRGELDFCLECLVENVPNAKHAAVLYMKSLDNENFWGNSVVILVVSRSDGKLTEFEIRKNVLFELTPDKMLN